MVPAKNLVVTSGEAGSRQAVSRRVGLWAAGNDHYHAVRSSMHGKPPTGECGWTQMVGWKTTLTTWASPLGMAGPGMTTAPKGAV